MITTLKVGKYSFFLNKIICLIHCFSSNWSIWIPALLVHIGFVNSRSACHSSGNGWHSCESLQFL